MSVACTNGIDIGFASLSYLQIGFLRLVQGFRELLPISSTAHMRIALTAIALAGLKKLWVRWHAHIPQEDLQHLAVGLRWAALPRLPRPGPGGHQGRRPSQRSLRS